MQSIQPTIDLSSSQTPGLTADSLSHFNMSTSINPSIMMPMIDDQKSSIFGSSSPSQTDVMTQAHNFMNYVDLGFDPMNVQQDLLKTAPQMFMAPSVDLSDIPNLPPLPEQFCTEFHQYNKQTYEQQTGSPRKRTRAPQSSEGDDNSEDIAEAQANSAEIRRQIHIQSEQKRRAQIKDGFEELRKQLPNCNNKQISKAAILHKTVAHLHHLKGTQVVLLTEIERLRMENEQLKRIQELLYPKQQTMNNVYAIGI